MNINNIDLKEVLSVDGGLSYILHRYPQAAGCENHKTKRFKLRDGEKTASASLKQLPDGRWGVTDFGGDGKMMNAVNVAMHEDNVDFVTALKTVAAFYEIGGNKADAAKPDYNKWPARADEQEGKTVYETKELTAAEIKTILTEAAWQALAKSDLKDPEGTENKRLSNAKALFAYYHLKSVAWKKHTSKGETHEFRSNDRYPIFIYEEGDGENKWGRFYQPRAEKQYRFSYFGEKPRVFIHGQSQAFKKRDDLQMEADKAYDSLPEEDRPKSRKEDIRLPAIINCSGGSDAMNVAALGYQVVWRNSESEEWTETQFYGLRKLCDFFYNLPDIDLTGVKMGHKLALQFLEMKTIWLPERLLEVRDSQGKVINKDLRDYLRFPHENGKGTYKKRDFDEIVNTALPYQFWDVEKKRDKNGNPIKKFDRDQLDYKPNNQRIYNFLYRMGYCRLKTDKNKEGFVFVHVDNNIVREVEPTEMVNFIYEFLEKRNSTEDLMNAFYRSPNMSVQSLSNIRFKAMDFTSYGPDFQYLFFENVTWKVTANGIQELPAGSTGMYVWEDKVLKLESLVNGKKRSYKAKLEDPFFKASYIANGEWQVDVLRNDCLFFNYIIQTCRTSWREELEERLDFYELFETKDKQNGYIADHGLEQEQLDAIKKYGINEDSKAEYLKTHHVNIAGLLLNKEEKITQMTHLANRMYVIGYALHRYKFENQQWAVWAMDNKLSEEGESHGGSGKSILTKAIAKMTRIVTLPSRNDKMTENSFLFENVTRETDIILVDDAHQHIDFGPFFAPISSTFVINRKNMKSIEIDFFESGKFWFNTNYGDKQLDPSTQRRKLHTVYSDYYHDNANGNYRESRGPKEDFGVNLFRDFDEKQHNLFYNIMAQCMVFYLAADGAVRAPGENINKRNLMAQMGDNFKSWADVYFSERLDKETSRDEAQAHYLKDNTKLTPQSFLKKVKAWCKFNGYIYNPADKCTTKDKARIIRSTHEGTKEMLYIDTSGITILQQTDPNSTIQGGEEERFTF